MTETTTEKFKERPFKPSFIDRSQNWIETLRVPPWVFYAALGMVFVLAQILFLLLEGGMNLEVLLPIILFNGLAVAFVLGLLHYLDNQAVASLKSMKPVLDMTESEFDEYEYRISTMRSLPPLIIGILLVALLLFSEIWIVPVRYAAMEQMPIFTVVYHVFDKLAAVVMGIFMYHTYVQLRVVGAVNSKHVRVNLFNLGPLRAFSRLTAVTAVGLVFGVYGWMAINPDLLVTLSAILSIVSITILSTLVFVLPLYGVHTLMVKAKEKELHDIDLRFESVFSKFNKGLAEDDDAAVERHSGKIASLEIQRRRVEAIPTWPWRPETGRIALTMIAIPLIMTVIRFIIDLTLGW
jgi:hypothetical protein